MRQRIAFQFVKQYFFMVQELRINSFGMLHDTNGIANNPTNDIQKSEFVYVCRNAEDSLIKKEQPLKRSLFFYDNAISCYSGRSTVMVVP